MNFTIRNEATQGALGLLRVIVVDGREVGFASRRHRAGNWTIYRGIGERAVPYLSNVASSKVWPRAEEMVRSFGLDRVA